MARANTQKHHEYLLEVELDPVGAANTFSRLCGLTDVSITRTSNIDTTEVPDCDDESLPHAIERAVRSQEVTISATGVWALQSDAAISDWWYGGQTLRTRMRSVKVETEGVSGDVSAETGPALLVSINHARTKGQKVTAEVEIQFDGVPARTKVV